jgi:hypothetical protein
MSAHKSFAFLQIVGRDAAPAEPLLILRAIAGGQEGAAFP